MDFATAFNLGGSDLLSAGLDWAAWEGQKDFARENRRFQAKREDSAVQRRVADLIAAGLNPMLAYSGAASSAASAAQPGGFSPSESLSRAAQTRVASAQAAVAKAQEQNFNADTQVKFATAENIRSQIKFRELETNHLNIAIERAKWALDAEANDWVIDRELKKLALAFQRASTEEKELMLPRMRNFAEAESSWWKREIAPYIEDASKIGGAIGANLIGGALIKRGIPGGGRYPYPLPRR